MFARGSGARLGARSDRRHAQLHRRPADLRHADRAAREKGRPVLGVIDQPIARERWLGAGRPTTLNGTPVRTRACPRLARAHLATTQPAYFRRRGRRVRARRTRPRAISRCGRRLLQLRPCSPRPPRSGRRGGAEALRLRRAGADRRRGGGRMCDWAGEAARCRQPPAVSIAAGEPARLERGDRARCSLPSEDPEELLALLAARFVACLSAVVPPCRHPCAARRWLVRCAPARAPASTGPQAADLASPTSTKASTAASGLANEAERHARAAPRPAPG